MNTNNVSDIITHEVSFENVVSKRSKRSERSEFVVRRVPSKTSACDSVRAYVRSFVRSELI